MKHNLKVIIAIVSLFLITQFMGLWVTDFYSTQEELPLGIERPEVEQQSTSFIPVFILILFATVLSLVLIKFRLSSIWRIWFILTVWLTLTISLAVLVGERLAVILASVLALLKTYKNNAVIHNFTEIFIYGALAVLLSPIFNITSALILLILISIYDYIAVRKTKHMVSLAKSQSSLKVFTGIMIPYKKGVAILGGGDIGFPLLFSAVVMRQLSIPFLHYKTLFIPLAVSASLLLLFIYGKEKKYYPAMPYVTIGCIAGFLAVLFL